MTFLGLLGVVAVLFVAAVVATRDDPLLQPAEPDAADLALPEDDPVAPEDLASLRLPVAVRGYRMAEVDVVLERLAQELALRDARIAELEAASDRPAEPPPGFAEAAEGDALDDHVAAAPAAGPYDVAAAAAGVDVAPPGAEVTAPPVLREEPVGAGPAEAAGREGADRSQERGAGGPSAEGEAGTPAFGAAAQPEEVHDAPHGDRLVRDVDGAPWTRAADDTAREEDPEPPHGDPLTSAPPSTAADRPVPAEGELGGAAQSGADAPRPLDPEPPQGDPPTAAPASAGAFPPVTPVTPVTPPAPHGDPLFPAVAPPEYEDDPQAGDAPSGAAADDPRREDERPGG